MVYGRCAAEVERWELLNSQSRVDLGCGHATRPWAKPPVHREHTRVLQEMQRYCGAKDVKEEEDFDGVQTSSPVTFNSRQQLPWRNSVRDSRRPL